MRLRTTLGMCSAAMVLALSGCAGSVTGGSAPRSIEKKVVKLATDSMNALAPVPGHAVLDSEWSQCSEETPGVHRASYMYSLKFNVDESASRPVFDQELAYWTKQGYDVKPARPDNPTREAYLPDKSEDWSVGVGIDNDGQMFLTVEANCVHVSGDPNFGPTTPPPPPGKG